MEFVQATLDMISINLQDDPDKHAAAFEKAVGGERGGTRQAVGTSFSSVFWFKFSLQQTVL